MLKKWFVFAGRTGKGFQGNEKKDKSFFWKKFLQGKTRKSFFHCFLKKAENSSPTKSVKNCF